MKYVLKTKGEWKDLKAKLKSRYEKLSDIDLEFGEGKYEEMVDKLGNKLGKTRQELIRIFNSL